MHFDRRHPKQNEREDENANPRSIHGRCWDVFSVLGIVFQESSMREGGYIQPALKNHKPISRDATQDMMSEASCRFLRSLAID